MRTWYIKVTLSVITLSFLSLKFPSFFFLQKSFYVQWQTGKIPLSLTTAILPSASLPARISRIKLYLMMTLRGECQIHLALQNSDFRSVLTLCLPLPCASRLRQQRRMFCSALHQQLITLEKLKGTINVCLETASELRLNIKHYSHILRTTKDILMCISLCIYEDKYLHLLIKISVKYFFLTFCFPCISVYLSQ